MNCPYCNSPVLLNDWAGNHWYKCGTTKTFRSESCVDREPVATELRNALARIKRLEDARTVAAANSLANMLAYEDAVAKIKRLEEAVQIVEDAAHSVQDWSGTALGDALDELNKAKEAKP